MGFFDIFRRKKPAPTKTVGAPGFSFGGGVVMDREKSPTLIGAQRYRTFADLLVSTSIVAAGVRAHLNVSGSVNWRLDPANDTPEARRVAELAEAIIHDMRRPWHRVVRRGATQPLYGYDIQEKTLKRRPDGAIGYLSIYPRPQHTIELWDIDPSTGEILGVVQRDPSTGEEKYLHRWKIVYAGDDSLTDDPRGLGLLRQVTAAADRLARYEQLEGFGMETDLRGIPVGYAPLAEIQKLVDSGDLTKGEAAELVKHMTDFLENHIKTPKLGLLLDSMVYTTNDEAQSPSGVRREDIKLLQGNGSSLEPAHKAIQRINHEIARTLGVEWLLLGQERGSQALSKDKTSSFKLQIETTLTDLAWTFQQDIIKPLAVANGWPDDLVPSLEHDPVRQADIDDIAKTLADMARAGAPLAPDDPVIDAVRDLAHLPRTPEIDLAGDAGLRREPGEPDDDEPDPGEVDEVDDVDPDDEGEE